MLLILNLIIISIQIRDEKGTYVVEKAIASITLPILEFGKKTSSFVVDSFYTYIANVNGQKKYHELINEMRKLKAKQQLCRMLENENKKLKGLLLIKYTYNFKFIGTKVIDNMAFSGVNIITIDKGKRSGVRENSAVVDEKGIVGRVWKLFPNQSQVQLISDNSSGVGVVIPERDVGGVLTGTGNLYYGEIKYISKDVEIKKGDLVFTSGTDGIYPSNLFVGKVEEVSKDKDFFLKIKVRFAASLSALRNLVVMVQESKDNE
ncbi:rod shape-determining protein MreC [Thermotomaculum hydrothermale]|uniref:rod shape-determining protein MreC n=1 Tax=Thermotomaculum hydrothermale TaxID=981385 RepID=UPI0022AA8190|nr:rod shape-determining protein MreC [Thermotomaculum hydrothermale]